MQQNTFKALLIILVMIDHNDSIRFLVPQLINPLTFHVLGFLALPFIITKISQTTLSEKIFRYLIPHILFLTIAVVLFQVMLSNNRDIFDILTLWFQALITGSGENNKVAAGFSMFWFLPTLCSILILKTFIEKSGKYENKIYAFGLLLTPLFLLIPLQFLNNAPLQFLTALFLIPQCFLIGFIWKKVSAHQHKLSLLILSIIISFSCYYLCVYLNITAELSVMNLPQDFSSFILVLFTGISCVITLYLFCYRFSGHLKWLTAIGQHSLLIYLIHNFIYAVLRMILPSASTQLHLVINASVTFITALFISLIIAKFISNNTILKKLVIPKNSKEFISVWRIEKNV